MEKNIILTGGTGFIGSHLVENLLDSGKNIIILKRSFSNTWRVTNFAKSLNNLKLIDIDKVNISDIFFNYNIEGILHLATYYSKFHTSNEINNMIHSNINFPTNLLDSAVKNDVEYFINTGSCFEYSWDRIPISENNVIRPFNLYASTKVAFEDILRFYSNEYGIKSATLKLFTPYGPKDDENKIIPYLIINSIQKNKISIKTASKRLDPIFIDDIINAYKKTMNNINNFEKSEDINIASGKSHKIKEIYNIINSILGSNEVEFFESDLSEIRGDINKAKELINWEPKINFKKGVAKTIDFYQKKLNND